MTLSCASLRRTVVRLEARVLRRWVALGDCNRGRLRRWNRAADLLFALRAHEALSRERLAPSAGSTRRGKTGRGKSEEVVAYLERASGGGPDGGDLARPHHEALRRAQPATPTAKGRRQRPSRFRMEGSRAGSSTIPLPAVRLSDGKTVSRFRARKSRVAGRLLKKVGRGSGRRAGRARSTGRSSRRPVRPPEHGDAQSGVAVVLGSVARPPRIPARHTRRTTEGFYPSRCGLTGLCEISCRRATARVDFVKETAPRFIVMRFPHYWLVDPERRTMRAFTVSGAMHGAGHDDGPRLRGFSAIIKK